MMQAIQNLGLGLASMGAGMIVDYKGYIMLENVFLMSLSSECSPRCFMCGLFIYISLGSVRLPTERLPSSALCFKQTMRNQLPILISR